MTRKSGQEIKKIFKKYFWEPRWWVWSWIITSVIFVLRKLIRWRRHLMKSLGPFNTPVKTRELLAFILSHRKHRPWFSSPGNPGTHDALPLTLSSSSSPFRISSLVLMPWFTYLLYFRIQAEGKLSSGAGCSPGRGGKARGLVEAC